MEGFQKIVLIGAIIILIITLVTIGVVLAQAKNENWPPVIPNCPDYWLIDGSGNNTKCINQKDLGGCPAKSGDNHLIMDFNSSAFTGSNGMCAKYNWAKTCDVSWDGITYGVQNPCQTTQTT